MNYNKITYCDVNNGPGFRVSLFTQGCSIRCPGCFNSELWNFKNGKSFTLETLQSIIELINKPYITGLSILGGEPLDNDLIIIKQIIEEIKKIPNKNVWVYTGHIFEELSKDQLNAISNADVLVDGPFIEKLKDSKLKFRGSSNQRLIDLQKTFKENIIYTINDGR